jgi:hypothetical protein
VAGTCLLWLASIETAGAESIYDCRGVGVIVDSSSDAVLTRTGRVGCIAATGATLTLSGDLNAAGNLDTPATAGFVYDSHGRLVNVTGSDPTSLADDFASRLVSTANSSVPPRMLTIRSIG